MENTKVKWISIVLVLLLGLGAFLYYFGGGDLFKGQAKLDAQKKACEKIIAENKNTKSITRCYKSFPELKKSPSGSTTQSTKAVESGFDTSVFKISSVISYEMDFSPTNVVPSESEMPEFLPKFYYKSSEGGMAGTVIYTLPSYTDENLPPKISLPVGLELCTSGNECSVVKQQSISLVGGGQANTGGLEFSNKEFIEDLSSLGIYSDQKVKFRLSIKKPVTNEVVYSNYYEVKVIKK